MKDIKSYVIGFLTCACLFLIMGQTKSDNQNGRYQAFLSNKDYHLIDTRDGHLYNLKTKAGETYWTEYKFADIQSMKWRGVKK